MSTVDFNDMQGGPSVPPMAPGPIPQAHPTSRWPKVIGIIAIVLGSLGALGGCVGMFGPMFTDMIKEVAEGQPGTAATVVQLELAAEWATWTIVQSICGLAVGVVLILAGVGLLKRRGWGPKATISWAVLKMLLVVGTSVIAYGQAKAVFDLMADDPNLQNLPQGMMAFGSVFTMIFLGLNAVWGWALPVFMLIWFSRSKIKAETAQWT
ncbi:MAG: hypothetical protein IID36_13120 [Planctomycetes bacterium]|nr:hypothetical protein [Planctomycetota bacterium]